MDTDLKNLSVKELKNIKKNFTNKNLRRNIHDIRKKQKLI